MYSLNFVCVGNDCVFLQKRNAPMINGVCHRNSALFIAFFKLCVLRTFIFAFGFQMCYCGRVIITVEVLKFLEMTWSEHHSRVLWPSWPFFFFIIIIDFFIARTTLEAVPQLLTIRKSSIYILRLSLKRAIVEKRQSSRLETSFRFWIIVVCRSTIRSIKKVVL